MWRLQFCFCVPCAVLGTLLLLGLLLLSPGSAAAIDKTNEQPAVSFINDIAPIFKENCFACHAGKTAKGKLDMTRYASLRKGGTREAPFVPGSPEESLLIDLITATDQTRMPPPDSGAALPVAKVELIKRWIKEGARLDEGIAADADLYRELRIRRRPPAPRMVYRTPEPVTALAFTPDNKKLVVGGHHELTLWDIGTVKLERRIRTRAERARDMLFLPDGKLVVAGGWPGQEGDVRVYDLRGGKPEIQGGVAFLDGIQDKTLMVKQLHESDDEVLCLALSADGKKLAAGGCDRVVHLWDLSQGVTEARKEQSVENHADWVLGIAFTPDGNRMVTASRDKTVKGWNLASKESAFTMSDHQAIVTGLAVRATLGMSVGEDKQMRFWDASGAGRQIRAVPGHSDVVTRILAHPRKPLIVTASQDKTIRLWNMDTGATRRVLSGHTDCVFALALSPDGELLASGSQGGEVKIWKLADGSLVKEFNASPGLKQAKHPWKK